MGQSNARFRLEVIKENVDEITKRIQSGDLTADDRNRSHDILIEYVKELKFMLSKTVRASRLRKVERLIIAALEDLATLEGTVKNVEPRLKAKSLQTLTDIEENMKTMNVYLTNPNFESEKEAITLYKKRLSLIDEVDQDVGTKKNEVLDVVSSVENVFTEREIEEKLKQLEAKHYQSRLDLNSFVGMPDSDSYKQHKEFLLLLNNEVSEIIEVSVKVKERKKYLLYNIKNNISALDQRVRENEKHINKQITEEQTYNITPSSGSNQDLVEKIVISYREFEKSFSANCTLKELQDIFKQLRKLKIKIDQKLQVLENQIQIQDADPFIELVPVKESEDLSVKRVTITQDFVDAPVFSTPLARHKMEGIQKNVEDLQTQITNSRYSRGSYVYNDFKRQLEDCRYELENLPHNDNENHILFEQVAKNIDSGLNLVENNTSERKSTTGDLLIDIMSITSIVNELGAQIKQANNTIKEYDSIGAELEEQLFYLRKLEIPSSRSNICKFRDFALIQIDSHLSNLDKIKKTILSKEAFSPNLYLDTKREINVV